MIALEPKSMPCQRWVEERFIKVDIKGAYYRYLILYGIYSWMRKLPYLPSAVSHPFYTVIERSDHPSPTVDK